MGSPLRARLGDNAPTLAELVLLGAEAKPRELEAHDCASACRDRPLLLDRLSTLGWCDRGLGALLERVVHLLKPEPGLLERRPEQADENAAEALGLHEARAAIGQALQPEAVLTIEVPGTPRRPSQRSSRSASADRTVGLKVIARPPGGVMSTTSRAPSRSSPLTRRTNGFHSP